MTGIKIFAKHFNCPFFKGGNMKLKKFPKKLVLGKEVIANLQNGDMIRVIGGIFAPLTYTCEITCKPGSMCTGAGYFCC